MHREKRWANYGVPCTEPGMHDRGGLESSVAPCWSWSGVHHHELKRVTLVARVDNLWCRGQPSSLDWLRMELQEKYDINGTTTRGVNDDIKLLGSQVRLTEGDLELSAEPNSKDF